MPQVYANNFSTTLDGDITAAATSITLASISGLFTASGDNYGLLTIYDGTNREIVKVTASGSNPITVVRAQEGTSAFAFSSGTSVRALHTKGAMERVVQIDQAIRALRSTEIDLTATPANGIATIVIPSGFTFYADRIDITIQSSDTVSTDPEISVGTTSGGEQVLNQSLIEDTTLADRTSRLPVTSNGLTGTIYINLDVAGTATALTGRVALIGTLVEDD